MSREKKSKEEMVATVVAAVGRKEPTDGKIFKRFAEKGRQLTRTMKGMKLSSGDVPLVLLYVLAAWEQSMIDQGADASKLREGLEGNLENMRYHMHCVSERRRAEEEGGKR